MAGYADGFRDGHAEGLQEGRALAVTAALPPGTRDRAKAAFDAGYRAGANSAFAGYDGGWSVGEPYVIVLAKGGNGVTYRIASRTPCPEASSTTGGGSLADHQVAGLSDRTVTSSGRRHRPDGPVV